MNRYIEISLSQNLSLLDSNYDPKEDRTAERIPMPLLIDVWSEITLEFSDIMDLGSLLGLIRRKIQIEALYLKRKQIHLSVELLKDWYIPDLITFLRENDFDFEFNPEDEAAYLKSLERVVKKSRSIQTEIDELELEMKDVAPQDGERKEKTWDDWEEEKILLEDDAGFALDWDKKTVYEFAKRYKNLIKKLQQKAKQNKINKP